LTITGKSVSTFAIQTRLLYRFLLGPKTLKKLLVAKFFAWTIFDKRKEWIMATSTPTQPPKSFVYADPNLEAI